MFFNFMENRITSGKERCDAKRVCTYANCARDYGGHESVINMAFNGSRSIYSGARSNNGTTGPVLMLINFKCISKITTPRRGELGNINVINRRQNRDLKAPMERWYHCLVVARSLSLWNVCDQSFTLEIRVLKRYFRVDTNLDLLVISNIDAIPSTICILSQMNNSWFLFFEKIHPFVRKGYVWSRRVE